MINLHKSFGSRIERSKLHARDLGTKEAAGGADFHAKRFAFKVFRPFDFPDMIAMRHDGEARFVIRLGEIHFLSAFRRDRERGDGNIDRVAHQGRDQRVKSHGVDFGLKIGLFGDGIDQIDVKTRIAASGGI